MEKIKYLENGKSMTSNDGSIVAIYREISEEEYTRLKALSYADLEKLFLEDAPEWLIYGYGYYGCGLVVYDGKYFFYFRKGNSCD